MKAYYPRFIPAPTPKDPAHEAKVTTEAQHKAINPKDYEAFLLEREADLSPSGSFTVSASASNERERCAVVAENFPNGGKLGKAIAAAIRGSAEDGDATGQAAGEERPTKAYPKRLRDARTTLTADPKHTVEMANGQFARVDVTVHTPEEERAARADGFSIEL